jgi:peptidyl-prolyl cis-trans isomerase SurA
MRHFAITASILGLALTPIRAAGQERPLRTDTLVRIVAVVGDSIITNGELQQALDAWRQGDGRQRRTLPPPGPELDRLIDGIMEERINSLLLVQEAMRDTTLQVTDDQARSAVDRQIQAIVTQQFGGNTAQLEQALRTANLTMTEYTDVLRSQFRHEQLRRLYLQKQLRDRKAPPVTDREIRDVFDREVSASASGPPTVPPSITFEQIVIPVSASDSALARARALADSLLNALRTEGADFAALARRFSEDPSSRELGGDVGWFRPGNMLTEFEAAAYAPTLRPGQLTGPVLTQYGYHIIRLERINGPERQAKHILIRPVIVEADNERARALADSVAERLRRGAPFDSLRRAHGDLDAPARRGPEIRDSLETAYREVLANVTANQVIGPIPYELDGALPKFVVVRVERVEPARPATVEDYRQQIQTMLSQQKLEAELVAELRRKTYIDIRIRPAENRQ